MVCHFGSQTASTVRPKLKILVEFDTEDLSLIFAVHVVVIIYVDVFDLVIKVKKNESEKELSKLVLKVFSITTNVQSALKSSQY